MIAVIWNNPEEMSFVEGKEKKKGVLKKKMPKIIDIEIYE